MPEQYRSGRIRRADVQQLLRRIQITPNASYSERFPQEMPCRVLISLHDGRTFVKEIRDYPGFFSQPVSWDAAYRKFETLAGQYTTEPLRHSIADSVANLENIPVSELTRLLASVRRPSGKPEGGADV
jgi:2-methylcitrate dehydratase